MNYFVQYTVVTSLKSKYTMKCIQDSCLWRLHTSVSKGKTFFQVKSYISNHTCSNLNLLSNHRQCSSTFNCRVILPSVKVRITIFPVEIMEKVNTKKRINITYQKA